MSKFRAMSGEQLAERIMDAFQGQGGRRTCDIVLTFEELAGLTTMMTLALSHPNIRGDSYKQGVRVMKKLHAFLRDADGEDEADLLSGAIEARLNEAGKTTVIGEHN